MQCSGLQFYHTVAGSSNSNYVMVFLSILAGKYEYMAVVSTFASDRVLYPLRVRVCLSYVDGTMHGPG